jgi:hypothetical protein
VAFGHMHSRLQDGRARTMINLDVARGTLMVNCAVCPRVEQDEGFSAHHFCVIDIQQATVDRIRHVWVSVDDAGQTSVHHEQEMIRRSHRGHMELFDHHTDAWVVQHS